MATRTRKSTILEIARHRLAGLKQISPKANLGSALTIEAYETEINGFSDEHDSLEGDITSTHDKAGRLAIRERALSQLNQRVLAAVRAEYGPDSNELALLGAIRLSDRKKPVRSTKKKAS